MEKKELLYEGKAKQVYATDDPNTIIMYFKDDATAFNGIKKAQIEDKGVLNNKITTILFLFSFCSFIIKKEKDIFPSLFKY